MTYNTLKLHHLEWFVNLLGADAVVTRSEDLQPYSHDETEDFVFPPEVVLKPSETQQVADILRYAHENRIPVTPMGARTGLSGGALALYGGIGLSMERFNRILQIDEKNHQVTVEPGVITQVLQDAVAELGLFYPPDPASRGSCFIGGNIAENSGGPRAVKYGVVKDFVLNLEVVLPNGEVLWTGANVLKNATGYNLTQLVVGSEGTLCVVTKIVLRLIPLPAVQLLMLIPFKNEMKACEAVNSILMAGVVPSALEFMEQSAVQLVLRYFPDTQFENLLNDAAYLLVEVDGKNGEWLLSDCETIATVVAQIGAGEIIFAQDDAEKNRLWNLRRRIGEAVRMHAVYKEEDTVVPRAALPDLLRFVKQLGQQFGFQTVCYGHAGDGNLHVNILRNSLPEPFWKENLPVAIHQLFQHVVSLGGTISAEHGIGYVQKTYMKLAFTETHLEVFRQIKKTFDPNNILNPGKVIDL